MDHTKHRPARVRNTPIKMRSVINFISRDDTDHIRAIRTGIILRSKPDTMQQILEKTARQNGLQEMPSVSIILPFNPKMTAKSVISDALGNVVQKISSELNGKYSGILVELVLEKLHAALSGLNYSTHKNSIAVYISPVFEKVLYLDIPVEEKVAVSDSFDIRDIVYHKAKTRQALLLAISSGNNTVFSVDGSALTCIVTHPVAKADVCERVRRIDQTLDILLPAYHGPLFIAGPHELCLEFRRHTRHSGDVLEYLTTISDPVDTKELSDLLTPIVGNMEQLRKKKIANYLAQAEHEARLMKGIDNIHKAGHCTQGSLLLVETGYVDMNGELGEPGKAAHHNLNCYSYINNPVDDLIEKALLNGGDVEFVEPGTLPGNEHIALIEHLHQNQP